MAAEAGALHSEGGKRCAAQAMHELAAAQHDALQHAARGGPEEQAALLQLLTLTPTPTPTQTPTQTLTRSAHCASDPTLTLTLTRDSTLTPNRSQVCSRA